jgi:hypothetical protein
MAAKPGTAESLYIDPTEAYKPTLDLLNKQKTQANQRYETNAADIKNIFGNLSTVGAADSARIREQFVNTIASQQAGLAARTAEARANQTAGETQQADSAAQRGTAQSGETFTDGNSATAVARERGIADANAYQTVWEALQNANQLQAQTDISSRTAGYGQQQVAAVSRLKTNLEDVLNQLSGRETETQSQLAQAKLGGQQNVASAKYQEVQTSKAEAAQTARDNAAIAAQTARDEAALEAQERANPTAPIIKKNMEKAGQGNQYAGMVKFAQDAYNVAYNNLNPPLTEAQQTEIENDPTKRPKPVLPTAAQIKAAWTALANEGRKTAPSEAFSKRWYSNSIIPFMHQYIDVVYGG